jgi:peptidoglycan/LPS O-acetylase OafA/YrhL
MTSQTRYYQLDSLRGIAALSVVFSHFIQLDPLRWVATNPLRLICDGHAAVILFFVLSGFALTMQLTSHKHYGYVGYATKRICRIYIPYVAAIGFALTAFTLLNRGPVTWAGNWLNSSWADPVSLSMILGHALFVAPFKSNVLDPVIWSLVYEMRISLIFPLVVLAVMRFPAWAVLSVGLTLSGLVFSYEHHIGRDLMEASVAGEWIPSFHYLLMFIVGAMVAKHRTQICWYIANRFNGLALGAMLCGAVLIYVEGHSVNWRVTHNPVVWRFADDWVGLIASTSIVLLAISFSSFSRILSARLLSYLGKISYSLYLLHTVVMLAVFHALMSITPSAAMIMAAALIVPASALAYRFVEKPAMKFGAQLSARWEKSESTAAPLPPDLPDMAA